MDTKSRFTTVCVCYITHIRMSFTLIHTYILSIIWGTICIIRYIASLINLGMSGCWDTFIFIITSTICWSHVYYTTMISVLGPNCVLTRSCLTLLRQSLIPTHYLLSRYIEVMEPQKPLKLELHIKA